MKVLDPISFPIPTYSLLQCSPNTGDVAMWKVRDHFRYYYMSTDAISDE